MVFGMYKIRKLLSTVIVNFVVSLGEWLLWCSATVRAIKVGIRYVSHFVPNSSIVQMTSRGSWAAPNTRTISVGERSTRHYSKNSESFRTIESPQLQKGDAAIQNDI